MSNDEPGIEASRSDDATQSEASMPEASALDEAFKLLLSIALEYRSDYVSETIVFLRKHGRWKPQSIEGTLITPGDDIDEVEVPGEEQQVPWLRELLGEYDWKHCPDGYLIYGINAQQNQEDYNKGASMEVDFDVYGKAILTWDEPWHEQS